jgi:cytochrome c biogenesis protein CcmG/thiol:disulfide interchange protein DsbE
MTPSNTQSRFSGKQRKAAALGACLVALAVAIAFLTHREGGGIDPGLTQPGGGAGDVALAGSGTANFAHPRPAPPVELKGSDGKPHRLEDLRGNAVIVHFWASWCPPCLAEIPEWLALAERWKGKPVRFMAISLDKGWEDALKILPDTRLPENVVSVLDTTGKLPDLFGTYQYPETYLLNRELKIVSKWVGPQDWTQTEINAAIADLTR